MEEEIVNFECKWNKQIYKFEILLNDTFEEFQQKIFEKTKVKPEHQKILNLSLKTSKKIEKESKINEFKLKKPKHTITLIGSPEKDILEINKIIDPIIDKIEQEIDKLIKEFYKVKEKNLKPGSEELSNEILKFDELFLQKMISLDQITKEELRSERKRLIIKIQIVLKDVDLLKETEKSKQLSKY